MLGRHNSTHNWGWVVGQLLFYMGGQVRPAKVTFDYKLEGTKGGSHADICFPGSGQKWRVLLMFQDQQETIM